MHTADTPGPFPASAPLLLRLRCSAPALCAAAAVLVAAAHVPVVPPHLEEAPYIGVLFILLIVASVALACGRLVSGSSFWRYASVGVGTAAVAAYCVSRLVALPLIGDDVGNWWEPLGVLSVGAEVCLVALSFVRADRSHTTPTPDTA